MIPAVARGILLFLVCLVARGETVDDAARALAKRISIHLAPTETARVTSRNLSSLGGADAAKVQTALDQALRRPNRSVIRNATQIEIAVTISENLRGYLLVAEIRRPGETAIEMIDFYPGPLPAPARAALALEKKLLWEQDEPILDVAVAGDQMMVLDPAGVTRYARRAGKWERAEAATVAGSVRDPRGRLEVAGDSVAVHMPGVTCRGNWKPALALGCEEGGELSPARNTFDLHDWRGAFFSDAELAGDHLVAELDGRTHVYDAAHAPVASFDGWGSDFAVMASACDGAHIAATAAGDRDSGDSIALYDLVNHAPVRVSDPVELPGPVMALWPVENGALAVARNLVTRKYAAYSLTLDCGR